MQFRPKFLGSTAAFALGILAMIAGVVDPESSMGLVGLVLTIGSLAYRYGLLGFDLHRSVAALRPPALGPDCLWCREAQQLKE